MPEHHPETASPSLVGVSYVMPVLNDATHVRAAVESILAQDYAGPVEVLIALGPSIDGTNELVADLASRDARVKRTRERGGLDPRRSQHRHPRRAVPGRRARRLALHAAEHATPASRSRPSSARAPTTSAASWTRAARRRSSGRSRSPTRPGSGLGGSAFHVGGHEGPAETVYLGVFRRDALERVGLFDETIKRGQDWELNRRLRETGGTVWFTPELAVTYRPRSTFDRLARQMFSTGLWRGELARRFPSANGIRYFIPPVMVRRRRAGADRRNRGHRPGDGRGDAVVAHRVRDPRRLPALRHRRDASSPREVAAPAPRHGFS